MDVTWVLLPECTAGDFKDLLREHAFSTGFYIDNWGPISSNKEYSNLFATDLQEDGTHLVSSLLCHIEATAREELPFNASKPRVTMWLTRDVSQDEVRSFWQKFCQTLETLGVNVRMAEFPDTSEPASTEAGGKAVGEPTVYREPREETQWYDKWCGKYLDGGITRDELNDKFIEWRMELNPYDLEPDLALLRSALYKRKKKRKNNEG